MIRDATGENLRSLHVSVLKWTAWGYLGCNRLLTNGPVFKCYTLTERGERYYHYMRTKSFSASRYTGLEQNMLRTCDSAYYWRDDKYVYGIVYPFNSAFCVKSNVLIYGKSGGYIPAFLKEKHLAFEVKSAWEALERVDGLFGDIIGNAMTDEVVRRGWIGYKDSEKTQRLRSEGLEQERKIREQQEKLLGQLKLRR